MLTVPRRLRHRGAALQAALTCIVVGAAGMSPARVSAQTARAARRIPVYVVDFRLRDTLPPELRKLNFTVSEVMRLALLEIPRVTPIRALEAPSCGSPAPTAQRAATRGGGAGEFYVVSGSISARGTEVLLDYALDQCAGDTVVASIVHETELLPPTSLLEGLTRAARHVTALTRRSLPKTTVAVLRLTPANPRDTNEVAAAALVEQELFDALWASPDFEVAEATSARYRLSGRVASRPPAAPGGSRSVDIQVRVLAPPAAAESLPTIVAVGSGLRSAAGRAARQALAWLSEAQYTHSPGPPGDADAGTLRVYAMELLCRPARPGCIADTTRAIAVLTTASERRGADWQVFAALGRLAAGHDPLSAARALARARGLQEAEQAAGRQIEIGDRLEVLNALGDARRHLGDFGAAASEYDRSLAIRRDQPEIQLQHARSLRLARQRPGALRTLAEALRLRPGDEELHNEALQLIRTLTSADVLPSAPLDSLVAVVRGGSATRRQQYADSLVVTGDEVYRAGGGAAHVRAVLEPVALLGPGKPLTLVNAYGYLAGAHLGTFLAEPGPNECIQPFVTGFDAARVDAYLDGAEAALLDSHPAYIREWIFRLRGLQLMREGRYSLAREVIDRGLALNKESQVRFAAGQVAFLQARAAEDSVFGQCGGRGASLPAVRAQYERALGLLRPLVDERHEDAYWYLRETLHSLGRDRDTREVLSAALRSHPDDAGALQHLKFVCNEYLVDFKCSFGAVKSLDSLGLLVPADTSGVLDAIEIALLAQEHSRAVAWQRWLTPEALGPRHRLVDAYYRFWIAAETLPPEAVGPAFQHWLTTLRALRSSKGRVTWSFAGAKHTIRTPGRFAHPCEEFMLQMIDAMEWPDRPAPTWAAQCGKR